VREVVGHEGVAALDDGEGGLALAHAAVSADHDTDTLDAQRRAVLGGLAGELGVDAHRRDVDEVHRDERCAVEGQLPLAADGEHAFCGEEVAGEEQAGDAAVDHRMHHLLLAQGGERLK
jgi:hypothetical protein